MRLILLHALYPSVVALDRGVDLCNNIHVLWEAIIMAMWPFPCMGVSIGYTTRCRFLRDLHYRWPQARGSVRSVETVPRCTTDLYHGAHDHRHAFLS